MKILKVRIENGVFVESNRVCEDFFSEKSFLANGWEGKIEEDGSICFEHTNRLSFIRITIAPSTYHKITIKRGDGKAKIIRKGFLDKNRKNLNGIVILTGGHMKNRDFYFINDELDEFLKQRNITAVIKRNPNQEYAIQNCYVYKEGEWDPYKGRSSTVYTDGKEKRISRKEWEGKTSCGDSISKYDSVFEVKNASWVIVCEMQYINGKYTPSVVLYTEEYPTKIYYLPKAIYEDCWSERIID